MIDRLDEIYADLHTRREHAQTKGWLGEIEGIDLTLRFLADKRADTLRLARLTQDTVTPLGIPTIRAPNDQHSTRRPRRRRTRRDAHLHHAPSEPTASSARSSSRFGV